MRISRSSAYGPAGFGLIFRVFAVGFVVWTAGCDVTRPKVEDYGDYESVRDELSPELAQVLLQDYATAAGQAVDLAMLEILEGTDDPEFVANAMRFRSAAVSEIRRSALRINPIVAALDSWVLYEQLDRFLRSGGGIEALGDRFRGDRTDARHDQVRSRHRVGADAGRSGTGEGSRSTRWSVGTRSPASRWRDRRRFPRWRETMLD